MINFDIGDDRRIYVVNKYSSPKIIIDFINLVRSKRILITTDGPLNSIPFNVTEKEILYLIEMINEEVLTRYIYNHIIEIYVKTTEFRYYISLKAQTTYGAELKEIFFGELSQFTKFVDFINFYKKISSSDDLYEEIKMDRFIDEIIKEENIVVTNENVDKIMLLLMRKCRGKCNPAKAREYILKRTLP